MMTGPQLTPWEIEQLKGEVKGERGFPCLCACGCSAGHWNIETALCTVCLEESQQNPALHGESGGLV